MGQYLHLHRVSSQGASGKVSGSLLPGIDRDQAAGGTTGGLPPLLFSGFRPIANRGQQ